MLRSIVTISALLFAGATFTRCYRHRQRYALVPVEQPARQRGFARTRRRRQDQHEATPGDGNVRLPLMGHVRSLQVLHLLAKLLDHALELEPGIGQVDIIGFRGERI